MFDESPMELDKMRRRREIRERLRFEYNRFSMNPLAAAYCMTLVSLALPCIQGFVY